MRRRAREKPRHQLALVDLQGTDRHLPSTNVSDSAKEGVQEGRRAGEEDTGDKGRSAILEVYPPSTSRLQCSTSGGSPIQTPFSRSLLPLPPSLRHSFHAFRGSPGVFDQVP